MTLPASECAMAINQPITEDEWYHGVVRELERLAAEEDRRPGRYRLWTERELEIVREYYHRVPPRDLARVLNRTVAGMQQAYYRMTRPRPEE